jgi:Ca2+-binding RTX toxin-like protein
MPNYDGVFFSVPTTTTTIIIPQSIYSASEGSSFYFEMRGDYSPGLDWAGNQIPEYWRGAIYANLSIDGATSPDQLLELTHSSWPIPQPASGWPWQIWRNNDPIVTLTFVLGTTPDTDAIDFDGDFGFFIRQMPFTIGNDTFSFVDYIYPAAVIRPVSGYPFAFPDLFQSSGAGDDVVETWNRNSVYDRLLSGFDAGSGNDRVIAGTASITINGGDGNDVLLGNRADDNLNGGDGNDWLNGGRGADQLDGGLGRDTFTFSARDSLRRADEIGDFATGEDRIRLDSDVFRGISGGRLDASEFWVRGEGRLTANDRIIYDPLTGELFYDRDGDPNGRRPGAGERPELFATLVFAPDLTHRDIFVF